MMNYVVSHTIYYIQGLDNETETPGFIPQ